MVNNAINPYWIVLLSPIFAAMWQYLGKRNMEPNDPIKFGLAFLQVALGFFVFVLGGKAAGSSGMVPLFYFVVGYLFLSTAELCISPIGLSMVTKLSPKHIVAMMMGTWFLASAFGQFFAGKIGVMMAIPTENGLSSIPASESLAVYSGVFMKIVYICIVGGCLIILSSPLIKKWMHGVK
jgi:POT family proton-dependent oligopeptide transporter